MSIVQTAATPDQPETRERESEDGSLEPQSPASLPEGIIAATSVHYGVGPYSYSRLEDALAGAWPPISHLSLSHQQGASDHELRCR